MPRGKVSRIVDGDTIKIKGGPYIRLENLDTPEKGRKGFDEARSDLKTLVSGKTVNYKEVATDTYGRTVAKVNLGSKSVNKEMKKKGWK